MRILFALTYYRPHVSGVTVYAQRLAEALATRGHHVTVLTSHYARELPRMEIHNAVHIERVPAWLRIGKGVVMPGFLPRAWALMRTHDVVSIHLPQLEAGALALLSRGARRPTLLTYHCDLQLPRGIINRCLDAIIFASNMTAGLLAHRIVAYTRDFAEHSPVLSRYPQKLEFILPPIVVDAPPRDSVAPLSASHRPVIGFAARLASEKGVEYLLQAIEILLPEYPELLLALAGEHENVMGEQSYRAQLEPLLERCRGHVRFLGIVAPTQMASFFAACDVLVLPSTNSTESFGLVQVEAMLCGTPVVATDLPGVRQPIRMTGMGEIVPPRDPEALAAAIRRVLREPGVYVRPHDALADMFDIGHTVAAYERLFAQHGAPAEADAARRMRATSIDGGSLAP
jgi:glycosyltransferase involved in cell wall biosynthesis